MIDWNWLWVAGELAVSYGFYRWWKSDDTFLAVLKVIPDIDINDLKQLSKTTSAVDYAAVHGLVQPLDSKANSVLTSQFVSHCKGVVQRLTIRERKIEKYRTIWSETSRLISDSTRFVPFRLVSPIGNFIRIERPLQFDSIEDHLDVTHVKFDANQSSTVQRLFDTLLGDIPTGIETKEQMLLIDMPLTGVGRLEKRSNGIWYLVPHEKWGGILTRSSRAEVIEEYRDRLTIARFLAIFFLIGAGCTATYLLYKFYSERRRRTNRLPTIDTRVILPPTDTTGESPNTRVRCVICLENEIVYSLQPCSHLGLCHSCAEHLQARGRGEELCPLCRTPIEQYQRVFLP